MSKVSKDLVSSIMKLLTSQPWLAEKISSVSETLEECDTEEQQKLLLDMLSRFSYIDQVEYTRGLKSMVNHLFSENGLKPSETQLYGLQMSRDTDSSNEVAYRVRGIISREIASGTKHFSTMNRIPEISLEERPFIVIVDEFVGSGQTAKIRLEHLFQRAKAKGMELDPKKIYLCYLAGMNFAIEQLRKEFPINFYCYLELKRGIEAFYEGALKNKAYSQMQLLENNLCDPCPETDEPLPYLGYGSAEALYYREEGNPPNSNFPVFWWSCRKGKGGDRVERNTLLRRSM
ncbi:MAG: hypothetical protein ACI92N_002841 [Pseudomonadales bacterium]|jgi:hypothetical protein